MTTYHDDPSKFTDDQSLIAKRMMEADDLQRQANEAKARALADQERQEQARRDLQARIEAGLAANQQLAAQRMGANARVSVLDGRTTVETINPALPSNMGVPPQALVDNIKVVTLPGGMEVSAEQAQSMYESGAISEAAYQAAWEAAVKPYGYSFR